MRNFKGIKSNHLNIASTKSSISKLITK